MLGGGAASASPGLSSRCGSPGKGEASGPECVPCPSNQSDQGLLPHGHLSYMHSVTREMSRGERNGENGYWSGTALAQSCGAGETHSLDGDSGCFLSVFVFIYICVCVYFLSVLHLWFLLCALFPSCNTPGCFVCGNLVGREPETCTSSYIFMFQLLCGFSPVLPLPCFSGENWEPQLPAVPGDVRQLS